GFEGFRFSNSANASLSSAHSSGDTPPGFIVFFVSPFTTRNSKPHAAAGKAKTSIPQPLSHSKPDHFPIKPKRPLLSGGRLSFPKRFANFGNEEGTVFGLPL